MTLLSKLIDRCGTWLILWGTVNSEVLAAMGAGSAPAIKSLPPHKAA